MMDTFKGTNASWFDYRCECKKTTQLIYWAWQVTVTEWHYQGRFEFRPPPPTPSVVKQSVAPLFVQMVRTNVRHCLAAENVVTPLSQFRWIFSIDLILPAALGPWVYSASNRNMHQKQIQEMFLRSRARPASKADNLSSICEPIV
jgi:hypothetical protein